VSCVRSPLISGPNLYTGFDARGFGKSDRLQECRLCESAALNWCRDLWMWDVAHRNSPNSYLVRPRKRTSRRRSPLAFPARSRSRSRQLASARLTKNLTGRGSVDNLVTPVVVRVEEGRATFLVGQLRLNAEAGADRIIAPHLLRRTDVKRLWKLLCGHGAEMDVAMQAGPADAVGLDDDGVVGLFRLSHASLPLLALPAASTECRIRSDVLRLNHHVSFRREHASRFDR
jgi:hypothetical protein